MFNNLKSIEFYDPQRIKEPIHIIGCGAIGAAVAELLVRLGVDTLHIWDADTVAPHNLGNQFFRDADVTRSKTEALTEILKTINPELTVHQYGFVKKTDKLSGYIFLCVDNIDLRRELCTAWKFNPKILFIIDGRMSVTSGNVYAADWKNKTAKDNLIASMQFTHEEVIKNTPVSACGMTISVIIAPRTLAALMVSNFIKFVNTNAYERFINVDVYNFFLESFSA